MNSKNESATAKVWRMTSTVMGAGYRPRLRNRELATEADVGALVSEIRTRLLEAGLQARLSADHVQGLKQPLSGHVFRLALGAGLRRE